jgi:hypothetical protein
MSLDPNFTPPNTELSKKETKKRYDIIDAWITPLIPVTEGIVITGSLAYGSNYSVQTSSDVDLQILVSRDQIEELSKILLELFPDSIEMLAKSLKSFNSELIEQFSLSVIVDSVTIECHFWNTQSFINASTFVTSSTKRIRSSNMPSIDYSFSFDGEKHAEELETTLYNDVYISTLPSYKIINGKLAVSRPIANALSNPVILHGQELLRPVFKRTWVKVTEIFLNEYTEGQSETNRIINALPGKYKMSPVIKAMLVVRLNKELELAKKN